ncbi:MAG TPA: folylpolyglutamate synthase/dihydrofolate synthase family protein [Vicinamibacterales bacterium]|nr:folylpolyglutamate synthase/dihydrofolate synthase family protein [Vicinamibacterales bacterium]
MSVDRLFALEKFGIKLGLDNIRALLAALGNPEKAWPSIHIGGTNGKGSVAAMVERGLRASGLRTGRYTSPHLDRIEERVAIDGRPIDRETFEKATADVFAVVDDLNGLRLRQGIGETGCVRPTFFEVSTAVAFEIFRRERVDVAVVEVGLGGRFDATNVLTPRIAAITSIALDHERHLGRTLSDIAFEKAGIAKAGVPLIVGRLPQEAAVRIRAVAADVGAPVLDAHATRGPHDADFASWGGTTTDRRYPPLTLALAGRHQLENAAVAVAILEKWSVMVRHVPTDAIVTGLTQCEWPARLEWLRLSSGGDVLIDAAHNPAGAAALASYLQDSGSPKLPIVFAAMADKDLAGMIKALEPVASMFVATTVPHARARPADQMAAEIRKHAGSVPVVAAPTPEAAVACALEHAPKVVAAGSIYMVGPLRARLIDAGAVH